MTTATEPAIEREYISPADAERRYGATAQFWRKAAREGRVKAYRLGSVLIAFRVEDIERFILSSPVTGAAPCRDGRRNGKKPGRPRSRSR